MNLSFCTPFIISIKDPKETIEFITENVEIMFGLQSLSKKTSSLFVFIPITFKENTYTKTTYNWNDNYNNTIYIQKITLIISSINLLHRPLAWIFLWTLMSVKCPNSHNILRRTFAFIE